MSDNQKTNDNQGRNYSELLRPSCSELLLRQAADAISMGIEYAQEALSRHDVELGRTIRKNQYAAEGMEKDIREMQSLRSACYQEANRIRYPLPNKPLS
jgi:hypothetical protein